MSLEVSVNDLPTGWKVATLEDVATINMGQSPPSTTYNSEGIGLPFFQGKAEFGELYPKVAKWCSEPGKVAVKDDVLISVRAPVGPTNIAPFECCIGRGLAALSPKPCIASRYLINYLRSVESEIDAHGTGTTLKAISGKVLREIPIPLAPLNEQNRIVAEVEKQFSRLDEAVANLKRVKANLKRYKATVLKAAVEGKLTEEWRRQHPDVEPADKLLERILAERRKAAGKGKYKEPVGPDTSALPELPAGWVWATVGRIAFVTKLAGFEYTKFVKYDHDGDLNVIKAENAGREGFKWTDFSRIKSETVSQLTRSKLKAGDLLMVFVGAGTGNVARVPDDRPYFLGPNIAMMRVSSSQVIPGYVEHFLRSPVGNSLALAYAKAVAQPSLSMETIRLIPLALAPLHEQHQIVAEVERRLSIVAEAKTEVDNNLRRADRLRQSILKQAFSGQLVPQDPNDVPASVLLERIRNHVGATRWVAREPIVKQGRGIASPLQKPPQQTASVGAIHELPLQDPSSQSLSFPSLDAVLTAILNRMQPGREYSRADLADPLGLSTGRWNAAIQELKRRGQVQQVGEKRGAKYMLV